MLRSADVTASALAAAGAALLLVWMWRRRRSIPEVLSPRRQSLMALRDAMALRSAFRSRMGLDIGGTLAKVAFASEPGKDPLSHIMATNSSAYPHLCFTQQDISFHFVTIPTHLLEETAKSIRDRMSWPRNDGTYRPIVAAGGGAHRFRDAFRTLLQVELLPFKELHAVVHGLDFVMEHGPRDELFTLDTTSGAVVDVACPSPLYPFLLVNLGSGVSVLRVTGPREFTRVGGTACGGATFLGLARALTGVSDFRELMTMAARGNVLRVDKLVGDIYGRDGCVDLGMPAHLTAASFGKLATASAADTGREGHADDIVASLLRMVVQASVVLAKALVTSGGGVGGGSGEGAEGGEGGSGKASTPMDRIFFVGGFVGARENELARRMIAESMAQVGGRAIFCKHAEFLGALGSLADCLLRHRLGS